MRRYQPFRGQALRVVAACLALSGPAFGAAPVVESFSASPPTAPPGGTVVLTVDAFDPDCPGTCTTGCGQYIRSDLTEWSATGGIFPSEDNGVSSSPYSATAQWQAPQTEGTYTISVALSDSGSFLCGGRQSTTADVDIVVTTSPNGPPVVESLTANPMQLFPGETSSLTCVASDPDGDVLGFEWQADAGSVTAGADGSATYTADTPGVATVTCRVTDPGGLSDSASIPLSVTAALAEKSITSALVAPQRLAVDTTGSVYVVDRSGGGITVLNLFSGAAVYRLALPGIRSVAVDWDGNLLVGGSSFTGVVDRLGTVVRALHPGRFLGEVSDVAVDLGRSRYGVLYRSTGTIVVYDEFGTVLAEFGSTGDGPGQLRSPQGLAVTPEGHWMVADTGHGRIRKFDLTGTLLASFGGLGGGPGEFVEMDDVEVDSDGTIYVSDSFQSWVQSLGSDGTPLEIIGTYGHDVGEFRTPTGIAPAESFDRLLVASANGSAVQVFLTRGTPSGAVLLPEPTVVPTSLVFGAQPVVSESGAQTVVLSNSGDAPLGVRGFDIRGDFRFDHDCEAFLDPGGSCSVQVTFAPTSPGSRGGSLLIDTSSTDTVVAIGFFGTGFVPPTVRLQPTGYEFPDQLIDTVSDPVPVALSNTGTAPLEITWVNVAGEYLASHDCGGSVPGGGSCTVEVRFAPQTAADHIPGSLSVSSNAAGSPHTVALDGRGVRDDFLVFAAGATVREGDGDPAEAVFEISLSGPSDGTVRVGYATATGTAVAGEDFEPVSGTLEFDFGVTSRTVSVNVLDDVLLESAEETFALELSDPVNGVLTAESAAGTILDDERCPGPNLLANPSAEQRPTGAGIPGWTQVTGTTWRPRQADPEPYHGEAYFSAGDAEQAELAQSVDVSAYAGRIDAGDQRFAFEGYVRSVDEPVTDTTRVVIEYRNQDDTQVLDRYDSGEVSSALGWLRLADERPAPVGTRRIRVRLISTRFSGTGNDGYFDALALFSLRTATLSVADTSAYEGDAGLGEIRFPVLLACPFDQQVDATYLTFDGTATAGEDYVATAGNFSLAPGRTLGEIPVSIFGDGVDEPHETLFVDVQEVVPVEVVPLDAMGAGTIVNDDFCPRSVGYWKSHPEDWPVDFLDIGGREYDRGGLLELFESSERDLPTQLAQGLAATKLNLAAGSDPEIRPTVEQADAFLTAFPPGTHLTGADKRTARRLIEALEAYNGLPCDNVVVPPGGQVRVRMHEELRRTPQ